VETYVPDFFCADNATMHADNRLVGRRILIGGKSYYKGYVGYVRSVAEESAEVALDANGRIEFLPLKDIVDLYVTIIIYLKLNTDSKLKHQREDT
jgi:hypothetical protein